MMRKLLIMLMTAVFAVTSSAQTERAFRMGVQINGGVSNNIDLSNGAAFGYGFGWLAEYGMKPSLYLQSGIGLQNIAYRYDGTCNAFYGQLPVHFGFRHALSEEKALFVQAGPTFSVGLWGSDISLDGAHGRTKAFDYMKRFDLALGGRLGIEIRKIRISAGANFGVTKVVDYWATDDCGHTLSVNLGIGYMF